MKPPRVNDFDPNMPSLKSPLDGMPRIVSTPWPIQSRLESFESQGENMDRPMPNFTAEPAGTPPVRTPVRSKRTLTRYAFEFFWDQVASLKEFSLEEQLRGEKGSMSQMVREAIDHYIAQRRRTAE